MKRFLSLVLSLSLLLGMVCYAAAEEDEYVTSGSIRFHERMGFSVAARYLQAACKFGRWYDVMWMHEAIRDHEPNPAPVVWKSQA